MTQQPAEKSKPFRLIKYFTFSSLTVLFTATIVLTLINTQWARNLQLKKSEAFAFLLIENLNHQIFLQFMIPVAVKFEGKISLRNREQYALLDKVVQGSLHSFKIEKVTIYDVRQNIVSYSFDSHLVGKRNLGGQEYRDALTGRFTSKLVQKGNYLQNLLGLSREIKLISFAPLRMEKGIPGQTGQTIGVIEVVQDLSEDYKSLLRFQVLVIATSTIVMGILFVILILIVKRGENIFQKRAMERLKLEEKLSHAERLSALGEMTAAISHEIRNPLGIISSSAEHLKKKMATVDPDNAIPLIIMEESARLNNIITDFINYARPRDLNMISCQVKDVLEKNLNFLASQIEEQGYRIAKHYTHPLPDIKADPDLLYQAFLNILINAMQSMPDGGTITVNLDGGGKNIVLIVEDEGKGFPTDVLPKIWDPFFTTKDTGTGLGLGIVKNIIESHGGQISVANRMGRGARVIIQLPIEPEKK